MISELLLRLLKLGNDLKFNRAESLTGLLDHDQCQSPAVTLSTNLGGLTRNLALSSTFTGSENLFLP